MRPVGSKYLLEETLGRGAMGTVWRGRVREDAGLPDLVPGQQVAVKVLKEELAADQDIVLRFLRERSVLLRLSHPNIVRVRDLVVEGELLALVMDLVDGPDLYRYLRANGPLSPIAAALLMAQIADALAVSHADGVVHRDLKPANVLLATVPGDGRQGEQLHPMLTDFGIARLADSPGITRASEFVGTPAYVAPESASGRPQTSAVDVYGAGIMLYELVTGRPPFQGDGALQVLQAHLTQEPPRPPGMPEPLWTVVERCLRKDPAQRPSATSLAHALRVVAAGIGVHASPAAVDAALGVAVLLLPEPQPAEVPGTGATQPDLAAAHYDPAAATQVLPNGGGPGGPGADSTRLLPTPPGGPFAAPPSPAGPAPAAQQQPEPAHPWQTQLRAARDRNQQTQVFAAEDFAEPPQRAPQPYHGGAGYPGPGYPPPNGYPQQGGRPGQGEPRPGYGRAERPPVAPPPYQSQRGRPGGPGSHDQGYRDQGYAESDRPYPEQGYQAYREPSQRPAPPAPAPARRTEPAPHRPQPPTREPEPERESRPRREPRPRSRNRMYIPGLGCLKGCLMVLLILAVAAVALWNFTPLPHYWDNVHQWWDSTTGWISSTWHSVTGN
ncbi:serine/threonine-protein kinase [Kitasatospora sp. GAS204A]|uniref:serine/threonine-protein kinase n=1 Tax=unclassified Kitasatospora TaxID=2633591 RepID=UPI002472F89A|nr:serine/threonine-protein kinase [Kitasatospora sp. GAS204B]MDH6121471.1 serine/threonine-protein kinase [Kitasatospora sp. GAS204B]